MGVTSLCVQRVCEEELAEDKKRKREEEQAEYDALMAKVEAFIEARTTATLKLQAISDSLEKAMEQLTPGADGACARGFRKRARRELMDAQKAVVDVEEAVRVMQHPNEYAE